MLKKRIAVMLLVTFSFVFSAFSVTAASAQGYSGFGNIEALIYDLMNLLIPIAIAFAVLGILKYAIPALGKFFGGLV